MKGVFLKCTKRIFLIALFISVNSCEKEVFIEPNLEYNNQYSRAFIDSKPQGAQIYIDGKISGSITPDTIKWLEGISHLVTLKKQYFFDTSFTINTQTGRTNNILIDYYQSDRMLGSIVCTSQPKGAKIYLDNVNTGKVTPSTLSHLIPKEYSVKFEYPEYRKDSVDIVLESMQTQYAWAALDDTLDVIKFTKENSDLPSNYITGIGEDKIGNLWIGTGSEGLVKYDGKKFINYRMGSSSFVSSNFVKRVKSDNENNVWVGYSNSIAKYSPTGWESFATDAIYMIQISRDNTMLASTDKKGIVKYSSGKFEWITNANSGLPSNQVVSMCYDNSGKLWVAPRNGGLDYYDGANWTLLDSARNGFPYSHCCGINVTNDGNIIAYFYLQPNSAASITTHTLIIFRNGAWSRLQSNVTAFIEDKDLYIDSKNRTWFSYMSPYPIIARVSNLGSGTEYFYNNILKSGIRRFKSWLYDEVVTYFYGSQAFIDSKGNLWIFGDKGLIKLKAGRWNN